MRKIQFILLCGMLMITGCNASSENSVETSAITKVNIDENIPEIVINEITETNEGSTSEIVEPSDFDYFVYAYSVVANTLGTEDLSRLTDAYKKAEDDDNVTYNYVQEVDETGVIEINYTFGDKSKSAYIVFDITNIDVNNIIDSMQETMSKPEVKEVGGTFKILSDGFECTDILSINASQDMGFKKLSMDSQIIFHYEDDKAYLEFKPIYDKGKN